MAEVDTLVQPGPDGADELTLTVPKPMGAQAPAPLAVGALVGRYVIVGELGRGAMGTVYRAYDPQLQREVALKRLRPGAADEHAAPRLIREARAMAQLSHPNVVAVHDVVVHEGAVTLAMECVEGGTLADWLETPRAAADVLAALVQAGRGLAAAHRAGMVHRDFKPGNVLRAADGTFKVTDFGLVKVDTRGGSSAAAASGDAPDSEAGDGPEPSASARSEVALVDDEALTRADAILGTPRYMAPEQLARGHADARSDQYALCVALWAALAGEPPFTGDAQALEAAKGRGPPPFPRTVDVPARVARAIRRGLAADPARRFEDIDALLAQLQPVGGSRRGWLAVGSIAAAVAAVVVATRGQDSAAACEDVDSALDGTWSQAARDEVEAAFDETGEAYAQRAWQRVDTTIGDYVDEWRSQRRDACEAVRVRREQTIPQMDLRVGCLESARARLIATLGVLEEADATLVANALDLVRDLPPLQRCRDLPALEARGPRDDDTRDDPRTRELEQTAAKVRALLTAGRFEAAQEAGRAAWQDAQTDTPAALRARIGRAYASALAQRGRLDEGLAVFRETLRIAGSHGDDEELARVALDLGATLLDDGGRTREAAWLITLGAGLAQRPGSTPALKSRAESKLGGLARNEGRWEEALAHDRRALQMRLDALGADHPDVAVSRNNLGLLLYDLDRPEEGIEPLRRARDTWLAYYGEEHPEVATARNNLAMVLERAGRAQEAEREYTEALRIRSSALGDDHAATISTRHNLGLVMMTLERHDEAEEKIRGAVEGWKRVLPDDHAFIAIGFNSLGLVREAKDDRAGAEAAFREAMTRGQTAYGAEHPQVCQFMNNLARTLAARDAHAEAVELLQRSLARCRRLGPDHRMVQSAREALAKLQPG